MNLRNFAVLFHTVILSHVLLAVSVNEKTQGRSTSGGGGLRIPREYKPNFDNTGKIRAPHSYKPKFCSSDSESDDCNIEFSSSDESKTRRIHSTTGGDKTGGLRKPHQYRPSLFPEVRNTITSAEEESESDDYNIQSEEESSSDESKTPRIPLRRANRLRSMQNLSVERVRPAHATRSSTTSAAKRPIRKPTRAHIQNLRDILAGKQLGVSKRTSKPVLTCGIRERRVNLINAVRYLLQPVLQVTNVRPNEVELDFQSLAKLTRADLLHFQESRNQQPNIDLSLISDWVYEKVPDNNQFAHGPNFKGIISLINTGKWVNRQGPDVPAQSVPAVSNRRSIAECSLTAFLKLTPETPTGNDSRALEKVKRELQKIARNTRYDNPDVIRIWCEKHIHLSRRDLE